MSNPTPRFFQYLAGERKNEIVLFDKIADEDGMIFIEFKDGSRCNAELILPLNDPNYSNQLMAEISDANNIWRFKEEWVGREEEIWSDPNESPDGKSYIVQPFAEGKKRVIPIPPRRVSTNFGSIDVVRDTPKISHVPPAPTPDQIREAKIMSDPIWGMMHAAKKFPTSVGVELEIMLPKKSLFEVANESFEDGGKKIVEYIIENLDISKLKDALRNALFQAYGEKYNEEKIIDETLLAYEEPIMEDKALNDISEDK